MKNILLGIIAINLIFISGNLYLRSVEPVQAEVDGMNYQDLRRDRDFRKAVEYIVERCRVDTDDIRC